MILGNLDVDQQEESPAMDSLAELRATLANQEAELAAMRNSTSWRLTAPLRVLSRFLKERQKTSDLVQSEHLQSTRPPPSAAAVSSSARDGSSRIAALADQPLAQRLSSLAVAGHRVAYLAENIHSSTYRYRAYNMVQTLAKTSQHRGALFFLNEFAHAQAIAQACSLMVISRARYDHRLAIFVKAAHAAGKQVWFDLDDYLFDTQAIELLIASQQQDPLDDAPWHYWYGVVGRIADAMALCDGVIASTPVLADLVRQFFKGPVCLLPNFANDEQLAVSAPLFEARQAQAPRNLASQDRVQLGYFSGSASHNGDFAVLIPALCEWMQRDARVHLTLAGPLDTGVLQARFASRIKRLDFMDYLALQQVIAEVDLNLIPLQSNTFTHCKSELKYFEAALVGTPSLASDVPVYQQAISHGINGFLAHQNDWTRAFAQVIDSGKGLDAVARAAHADALAAHTGHAHLHSLLALLQEVSRP